MPVSYRQIFLVLILAVAAVVAGARLAHSQAVNPTFIEFTSIDHAAVTHYRVCFYPSATSTTAARCNELPVSAAVSQGGMLYRIPRSAFATGLVDRTDYWPRVRAVSTLNGESTSEVAPSSSPFSFRLVPPPPRDVSGVLLIP